MNFAASVNDVRCRMRHWAAGFFVQQSVPINHFVIGVGKQREIETGLVFQLVAQEFGFVVRINADGQNFDFVTVLFFEQRFQLSKLSSAPRSPVAAIKHQNDGFLVFVIRQRNRLAVLIFQREVRSGFADFDPG